MRLPVRLTHQHPLRKLFAAVVIAGVAMGLAVVEHDIPGVKVAMEGLDNTLYDAFYRFRKTEDRTNGPIVIVTVDEGSLKEVNDKWHLSWPWRRDIWQSYIEYLQSCGARAVVFDIIFKESRDFDEEFGKAIDDSKMPAVMANAVLPDGKFDAFGPKVSKPVKFGAENVLDETLVRHYAPRVLGKPSLAAETVEAIGAPMPQWGRTRFLLHYYGPYEGNDGKTTYSYIRAANLAQAAGDPASAPQVGISPQMFKDKIVIIGATAQGTYDLKSSPLSKLYPGVEVHATAIDNLLNGQFVHPVGLWPASGIALFASALAAIGVVLPRRAVLKTVFAIAATGVLVAIAVMLFKGHTIHWLPMASPLLALLLATLGAFAWSYLTEDRQRRLVLKALSQYVSPEVAAEIARDPDALKLGGERRDMTVLFSDIQGFTDLSESMDSQKLSELLNFYLGEMSALILATNGTLDKYIGDAIMSFWSAPILQPEHAARACRAALAMREREAQIQPELAARGAPGLLTRIGINTGPMVFGNMGSPQKFNYSVLGDSVNLGSRLEGANKFYGSRILISETTAHLVKDQFVLRQLDLLRVKGKLKPLAVYELMAEGRPDAESRERIDSYGQAFAAYQAQEWDQAGQFLEKLRERFPHDLPAAALQKRVEKLRHDPPGQDWDGVFVAKDK